MRYYKKKRKSKKLFALVVFIIIETLIVIWQQGLEKVEEECYQPVGELVEVNNHKVHTVLKGEGELTLVFLTGSGTPCAYTDYYNLQECLSEYSATVSFDHAGFGWSEETSIERTVDNLALELDELLKQLHVKKSYVLVAHSLASLEAIRFAQMHPKQVKGIVFLDAGSPEYYKDDSETQAVVINRASAFFRVTGWNRLLTGLVKLPIVGEKERYEKLPEELQKLEISMYNRHIGDASNIEPLLLINENAETVIKNKKESNIPYLIISSDGDKSWTESQKQLTTWSKNATQVVLKDSTHYIHWSNEEEVEQLMIEFLQQIGETK